MRCKNLISILITCFFCLSQLSCKHPKPTACDKTWYVEIKEPLKHYLFQPGSYWVYKHENDGTIDTIKEVFLVDSLWFPTTWSPNFPDTIFQLCYIKYNNINMNKLFSEEIIDMGIARSDSVGVGIYPSQVLFAYSDTLYAGHTYQYVEQIPTMTVNGAIYDNVRHFKTVGNNVSTTFFQYDTELYYASDVGLIKYLIHDSQNGDQTFSIITHEVSPYALKSRCHEH